MEQVDEAIKQKVESLAKNGQLSCAEAIKLANTEAVPPTCIGRAANAAGVKIIACQLGCFGGKKGD
ncbi:MAG: hypothetical protein H6Q72_1633 [Firmicutes bacterium]|nr:hypothetical protein [Bacillota bacterium]